MTAVRLWKEEANYLATSGSGLLYISCRWRDGDVGPVENGNNRRWVLYLLR